MKHIVKCYHEHLYHSIHHLIPSAGIYAKNSKQDPGFIMHIADHPNKCTNSCIFPVHFVHHKILYLGWSHLISFHSLALTLDLQI